MARLNWRLERHQPKSAHIYVYFAGVSERARGQGVGSKLINFRYDRESLPMYIEAENPGAERLYERLGFVQLGRFHDPTMPVSTLWREAP